MLNRRNLFVVSAGATAALAGVSRAQDAGRDRTNLMARLPDAPSIPFQPQELVYARMTMSADHGRLLYATERSGALPLAALDDLVAQRCRLQPTQEVACTRKRRTGGVLDIAVDRQCLVAVELAPEWNWQFRRSGPALTTKADHGGDNCDLWHVNADGKLSKGAPSGDGCRLAYFSVVRREAWKGQAFNLHVEMVQSPTERVEIVIDPDIPDDGGCGIPSCVTSRES